MFQYSPLLLLSPKTFNHRDLYIKVSQTFWCNCFKYINKGFYWKVLILNDPKSIKNNIFLKYRHCNVSVRYSRCEAVTPTIFLWQRRTEKPTGTQTLELTDVSLFFSIKKKIWYFQVQCKLLNTSTTTNLWPGKSKKVLIDSIKLIKDDHLKTD